MTKRFIDTLAKRSLSWLSLLLGGASFIMLVILYLFRAEYLASTDKAVRELEETRRLFLEFRTNLGYGGFIHDFKNYVLRGTPDYLTRADSDMQRVLNLWVETQMRLNGLYSERSDVSNMLNDYAAAVQTAKETPRESAEALDRMVKVDDRPAFTALKVIDSQLADDMKALLVRRATVDTDLSLWLQLLLFISLLGLFIYYVGRSIRQERDEQTLAEEKSRLRVDELASHKNMMSLQQTQAERMGGFGTWLLNLDTGHIHWSDGVFAIHGRPEDKGVPSVEEASRYYAPDTRQALAHHVQNAAKAKAGFTLRFDLVRDDGEKRLVASSGQYAEHLGQRYLVGIFRDVTAHGPSAPEPPVN